MFRCKVSVCVGLGNEPRELPTPFLSVNPNPRRVACLDPACAVMKHMMLLLRHQLAMPNSPSLLASPLLLRPSPLPSLVFPVPVLMLLPSNSPFASPQTSCRRHLHSLVCTTSACPSISVKAIVLYMSSSTFCPSVLTREASSLEGRLLGMVSFGPHHSFFVCFPCYIFVLVSRSFTFSWSLSPLPSDPTHCRSLDFVSVVLL